MKKLRLGKPCDLPKVTPRIWDEAETKPRLLNSQSWGPLSQLPDSLLLPRG